MAIRGGSHGALPRARAFHGKGTLGRAGGIDWAGVGPTALSSAGALSRGNRLYEDEFAEARGGAGRRAPAASPTSCPGPAASERGPQDLGRYACNLWYLATSRTFADGLSQTFAVILQSLILASKVWLKRSSMNPGLAHRVTKWGFGHCRLRRLAHSNLDDTAPQASSESHMCG